MSKEEFEEYLRGRDRQILRDIYFDHIITILIGLAMGVFFFYTNNIEFKASLIIIIVTIIAGTIASYASFFISKMSFHVVEIKSALPIHEKEKILLNYMKQMKSYNIEEHDLCIKYEYTKKKFSGATLYVIVDGDKFLINVNYDRLHILGEPNNGTQRRAVTKYINEQLQQYEN